MSEKRKGYLGMGQEAIVACGAPSTESVSGRYRKIGLAAPNEEKGFTESQADLTRCPFSLDHYTASISTYSMRRLMVRRSPEGSWRASWMACSR